MHVCRLHSSASLRHHSTDGCACTTTVMPRNEWRCCENGTRARKIPKQYEVPDVEGCTPKCLKEPPLHLRALKDVGQSISDKEIKALITGLLELRRVSNQAKRPEFTDGMGEQLMDSNPPLPCRLAAFSSGDAFVGCFDDEAQTAMEATPYPNLIIPLKPSDPPSIRRGFRTMAIACETLAAASRLIDLMPGNEDGVIAREG
jgi:hypothetical protein